MIQYLQDHKGNKSSARLGFMLSVLVALLISITIVIYKFMYPDQSISDFITLVSVILGFAGGLKVGQKFAENKEQ
jgi:hypothetical protein